ncbi:MAG: type IV secretory system conjugative DNA transfer family protein [Eubacteriales bacterium]|nr:type IV secretory system conjugative DNA transfer family protein [Eubacteriales bacterium]
MSHDLYKISQYNSGFQETRWATQDEIKSSATRVVISADNYEGCGLPLIANSKRMYLDNSDTHSLIIGSTGSKKTRLFCMPMVHSMIRAGESFVVTDPKGEIFDATSGMAQELGYDVVLLNYRDLEQGDMWNPLKEPALLYKQGHVDEATAMLNDFVEAISMEAAESTKDIFWVNSARMLSLAVLLVMMDICSFDEINVNTFSRMCVEFGKVEDAVTNKMLEIPESEWEKNYLDEIMKIIPQSSIAALNYFAVGRSHEKTRADMQSSLFAFVKPFLLQRRLIRNLSETTFDIRSMGRKKTALYIVVPDERSTYHFIVTSFVKQCYELLITEAQKEINKSLPVRVNFVLDEFSNTPAISDMPAMITAARSRNIRFYLVVQSMHQLVKRYGLDSETIKGNCENWVFLASKELNLLEELSKMCGNTRTYEPHEIIRPLITVSELQKLKKDKGEALLFFARHYPYVTRLPDISEYGFKQLAPAVISKISHDNVLNVGPRELYDDINNGKRPVPFAGML